MVVLESAWLVWIEHPLYEAVDTDDSGIENTAVTFVFLFLITLFYSIVKRISVPTIALLSREDGDKILLVCKLKGYYPDKLIVRWFRDKELVEPTLSNEKFQSTEKEARTFTLISQLTIEAQCQITQYTCEATFNSEKILNQTYNVCKAMCLSNYLMHVKKPHLRDIMKETEVMASCVVEAPYNIEVSWLKNEKILQATSENKHDLPHSRTKQIVSNLTIFRDDWLQLKTLVCKANHPCFQKEESVFEVDDIKKDPVVVIRRPFPESTKADNAVLECVVRDLPLGEACITFQANNADISENYCVDLTPSESMQSLATLFTIPTKHHKKKTTFTCRVHTSYFRKWESKPTGNIFDDPTIELSVVPSVEQSTSQTQKLVCAGTGFDPKITWLIKSDEKTGTTEHVTIKEDGRVQVYSEILVSQQDWNKAVTYTCKIADQHIGKTAKKSTSICAVTAHSNQLAYVYLLGPSLSEVTSGIDVSLTCLVVGQGVRDFSIQWKMDGKDSNLGKLYKQDTIEHANGTQSIKSVWKAPVRTWDAYTLFTCEVKQLCSGKPQQQNISKTRDPKQPTVRILRPPDSELYGSQDASLLCFITGFYPSDISVQWQINGTKLDVSRFTNSPVVAHTARHYSMHSALILPKSQWKEGIYSCVVSHESTKDSIIDTLENLYASLIPSAPSAELLQGSSKLVCLAFGFSPFDIKITWLLGMTELSGHNVTSPAKGPDGKFSIQSHLHLLPSDWAPGEVYSCRVTHITGTKLLNISNSEIFEEAIFFNENKPDAIAQESVEESWNMACAFFVFFILSLIYGCTVTLVKVKPA
ncbi:uncharacterized protein LOC127652326 [Xyrauchen texanus]|uniref:uncharacterized protein LOC127652326 n=1 Tax=Xyrauchen texanus TaxID=154827 RepID=UPI0022423AE7|nr:uncharacterized protein LOC127652326 [Xyrauchen texanus]